MARNESWLVNTAAYVALRAVGAAVLSADVHESLALAGKLGDWWYRFDRSHRRRALENIALAFPHLDREAADELCRRCMRHLVQAFMVEVMFTPRLITPTTWPRYVRFARHERVLQILMENRPAIFITGHCGNFELLGYTLATVGFPLIATARPLDLPRIDDWIVAVRQRRGMKIINKFGAMEQLPDLFRSTGRVSFTADQNAGDRGMFVPFFGRLASAYKSISLMAIRYHVPIICGVAKRVRYDRFEYEILPTDVIEAGEWTDQPDPIFYLTARYTRAIEMMVRETPEQYFWYHRRWKSRPRHERENQPFPTSLKAKLASLPWMSAADVERVVEDSERLRAAAHAR